MSSVQRSRHMIIIFTGDRRGRKIKFGNYIQYTHRSYVVLFDFIRPNYSLQTILKISRSTPDLIKIETSTCSN